MKIDTQTRIDRYAFLLQQIKNQFSDDSEALAVMQEIRKDIRSEMIQQQRRQSNSSPATEKQVSYLKSLGAVVPKGLTKHQASKLIDEIRQSLVPKAPMRLP